MFPSYRVRTVSVSMAEENNVKRLFSRSRPKDNNKPQRIELPLFFNTPSRTVDMRKPEMSTQLTAARRLKDYEQLAFACKRGGKIRQEGRAYYSMGVLLDNIGKYSKALEQYKKFLSICKLLQDRHGEGLAYNCIGVDYQLLSEKNPQLLEKAIENHKAHFDLADINGQFLASINLGLCYEGDQRLSLFYHQQALKYAITINSLVGQTIAIGNIGHIGIKKLYDNPERIKAFIVKYLELAQELHQTKGVANGHIKLATLSATTGNYSEGKENFLKALSMVNNDSSLYAEALCGYAITNAETKERKFDQQI